MTEEMTEAVTQKLKQFFKFESFKSKHQYYATICVMLHMSLKNRDILINLPPAAGKSISFQLPTMLRQGKITIVIVPDEHTGEEQISFLAEHQIKAFYFNSKTYQIDIPEFLEEVVNKMNLKFIYVTPNMLTTEWFEMLMKEMSALDLIISIVIDEAHYTSEHYGKPIKAYREIYKLRDVFPNTPFIALTSIGTANIMTDIKNYLQLKDPREIKHKNWKLSKVYLQVRFKDILTNPFNDMKGLIKNIMDTSETCSGIISCSNCDEAIEVAEQLTSLGIPTAAYCSKLEEHQRDQNEQDWMNEKIPMLAVTYDFGMKLTKPSVKCIIHWTIPLKLEQYYEYIGKYTRYNKPILCRLYFSLKDWINSQIIIMKMSGQIFEECIKMIEYCMSSRCRHLIYSNYFGTEVNPCGDACDSCEKGSSVKVRLEMFRDFVNHHNWFAKKKRSTSQKIYKINQTDRVEGLTCWERYHQYENLEKAVNKNYESSHCANKPHLKTTDLHNLTKGLEYSIFYTSNKQQDYSRRIVKLIMKIENSTESEKLSNYIINYKYTTSLN